ncbi:integral membrane protein [Streptomyces sp. C]|nr:integral membrane protein [Streptomyces sp. C]
MSTAEATGFCRVTVVAPDSRIDVALPEDIAVADVYPELLRLTGQTQPVGAPTGFHLVRRSGAVLDGARTLAAQQVLDGEVLSLRPFAESLPPAVFDDVSDAVASAVVRDRHRWSDDMLRGAGLSGAAVLLVLLGFVLWYADPVRHDTHGLPGIIAGAVGLLLTAAAGVRARVYRDRGSAVALGLGALPHLLIAGSGTVAAGAGQGPGRLQFLLGCACVLVASVALVALTPDGDAPFVAATFLAATGTLASFGAIAADASATATAAVCAPVAIGLVAFLPALSARFARLPIGYAAPRSAAPGYEAPDRYDADPYADQGGADQQAAPLDAEAIAAQARAGARDAARPRRGVRRGRRRRRRRPRLLRQHLGPPAGPGHRPGDAAARPPLPLHLPGGLRPGRRAGRRRPAGPGARPAHAGRPGVRTYGLALGRRRRRSRPPRGNLACHPPQGPVTLLGKAARPHRGRGPAQPGPAGPGRARRVRPRPLSHQLRRRDPAAWYAV